MTTNQLNKLNESITALYDAYSSIAFKSKGKKTELDKAILHKVGKLIHEIHDVVNNNQ